MDVTMKHILILIFTVSLTKCGISIPKEDCRWITASDWNTELKCDGDQVAVGACSGGGGWGHKDCPGDDIIMENMFRSVITRRHRAPAVVLLPA